MTRLPMLSALKLIKIMRKLGFAKIRQVGSHAFFKHPDGRSTVIPIHLGKDIGRGLLRSILKDLKMSPEEFQKLL